MLEKRKFIRLDINAKVDWKKLTALEGEALNKEDVTKNISAGGICLIVYERLVVGDILNLTIELPTQKVIHSKGRVVWAHEFEIGDKEKRKRYDVGIEFLNISQQDREEVKKFVFTLLHMDP